MGDLIMKLKGTKNQELTPQNANTSQAINGAPLTANNQIAYQNAGAMQQVLPEQQSNAYQPNGNQPMVSSVPQNAANTAVSQGMVTPYQTAQQQPLTQSPQPALPQNYSQQVPQSSPQNSNSGTLPTNTAAPPETNKNAANKKTNSKLKPFKYTVINAMNKKENGTFDAEDIEEVRSYLESQDYKVLSIKPRGAGDIEIGSSKLSPEDLSFTLTQLSTYIRAGIPLVDSVKILAKQASKPGQKKIWGQVVYELLHGENFSVALEKQGKVFPSLLVNMVKTSEMTGDLPSILDDMAEYYTSMNATRKQMKSAMTYPIVILTLCFGVLIFMLVYLVPQFSSMFEANDAKLPEITLTVLGVSNFVQEYWLWIIIGIVAFVLLFMYLFKKVASFRTFIQTLLMKMPVVSKIIIYNEIANFTKTFASLINHGVFITDSMEILSKITNNEVYKKIINKTMENLQKGDTVSSAFRGQWAVPVVAYEMIVTGENTGQLGLMMEKVAKHFQTMHKSVIDQMKSLMEPMMMIVLAGIVAVILLSIVTPMFSMYEQID